MTVNRDDYLERKVQLEAIPTKKMMRSINVSEEMEMNSTLVAMNENAMKNFK